MRKQRERYEKERHDIKQRERYKKERHDIKQRERGEKRLENNGSLVDKKTRRSNIYSDKGVREKKSRISDKNSEKSIMGYYKSFSNKPSTFKEMYETDNKDKYSSSDDDDNSSSSSEDFPCPKSPRKNVYKRSDDDYGTIFNKLNELQKRMCQMELKQKKNNTRESTRR